MKRVILASESPRRLELLKNLGLVFEVRPPEVAERMLEGLTPCQLARRLAQQKAVSVAGQVGYGIIIGADTIVVLDGMVMGKPTSRDNALAMLSSLSGRKHQVITGLCVVDCDSGRCLVESETTDVFFRTLSIQEINAYLDTPEPYDKAGAYGIQGKGAILVEKIEGCYHNVVGLPLTRLYKILKEMGVDILAC